MLISIPNVHIGGVGNGWAENLSTETLKQCESNVLKITSLRLQELARAVQCHRVRSYCLESYNEMETCAYHLGPGCIIFTKFLTYNDDDGGL